MNLKPGNNKPKLNHTLWLSMSSFAAPKRFNYLAMSSEQLLQQYIARQLVTKKEKYLKIVNSDKRAALEVAEAVLQLRRGTRRVQTSQADKSNGFAAKPKAAKFTIPEALSEVNLKSPDGFLTIFVDAGTLNNGRKGYQKTWVALAAFNGEVLEEKFLGDKTNNEGEILAIIQALNYATRQGKPANIYSDSRVTVKWALVGHTKAAVHADHLAKEAYDLLLTSGSKITWIPRELNRAGWYLEKKYRI